MVGDGGRPSLAVTTEDGVDLEEKMQRKTRDIRSNNDARKSLTNPAIRAATGLLVTRDNAVDVLKKIAYVEGKGKSVIYENEIQTPRVTRNPKEKVFVDPFASSSEMKIYLNRFGYSNAISGLVPEIKVNFSLPVNRNFHLEDRLTTKEVGIEDKVNEIMPEGMALML
ncbi:hypothetical protein MA16_Dca021352 [Dendrobium catenatum]|uniref:Uncharacterized protein n=1 Tax=Dendrobium catenatum TaxID=906689 RepID=A0A2I0X4Y7_9ASPA|nr:hypothetical protein MA16_Dca021352 [Dendrobium catenatum]